MEPDTDWTIIEPGVLALPTTKLVIRWTGLGSLIVEWNGSPIGAAGDLDSAKEYARDHMRQLMQMGMEP